MAVSIENAIKTIKSDNYNKKNIQLYFIVQAILPIMYFLITLFSKDIPIIAAIFLIPLTILFTIYLSGVTTLATHNAIWRKKGVFPNLSHFGNTLKCGIKSIVGMTLLSIMYAIILALPMCILIKINPFLGFLVLPLGMYLGVLCIGFYMNFYVSLKFSEWLNWKNAHTFMKKAYSRLAKYMLICILLLIILTVICWIPAVLITKMKLDANIQYLIASLINCIVIASMTVLFVEINAQFVRSVLKLNKKPTDNNPIKKEKRPVQNQ